MVSLADKSQEMLCFFFFFFFKYKYFRTSGYTILALILLFMQLFIKILSGMANSVDPD